MADQFQAAGNCGSGSSWWSTAARAGGFHGLTMPASISCSPELANIGGNFNWDMFEAKSRSCDESPAGSISNSSLTFQDIQDSHVSAPMMMAAQAMDFGLSSPTIEWSQPFFSSSGRTENSFHALLQEDVISRPYVQQTSGIEYNHVYKDIENSFSSPLKDVNRSSLQDEHVLSSNASGIPHLASSCRLPPMLLQGLLEPDNRLQRSCYKPSIDYHEQMNESLLQSSLPKSPQFVKASPPNQQLQFSNNTPFWNPTASSVTQAHSIFHHARPPQLVQNQNSSFSNLIVKNTPGIQGSCSAMEKSGSEPAFKKPRIETLSPLPTFKVRKEKLGDRVTALQQLVSPFGKTDTASVLHEAIEYIKFLHEQVRVLSAPYLKNGHQVQQTKDLDKSKDSEGQNQDLRSQGLCLVPISSTFPVANEIPTDFWAPTFIGTFR